MIPIVSSERMTDIDRTAQQDFGIPGILLMEQAGNKAFSAFLDQYPEVPHHSRMVFTAGGGNNGGDALVMARTAYQEGYQEISIVVTAKKLNDQMTIHERICRNLGIPVYRWQDDRDICEKAFMEADYLFDGIAGTGIRGALRGSAADAVVCITAARKTRGTLPVIIAVDTPSGLTETISADSIIVQADLTVTMGLPKVQFYLPDAVQFRGEITIVNPGFPAVLLNEKKSSMNLVEDSDIVLPSFARSDYKQRRGHAAVFAGAPGTSGAAALTAEACARMRTGLVTVYCERTLYPILAVKLNAQMVRPEMAMSDSVHGKPLHEMHDAVIAGPGWGRGESRIRQLEDILEKARCGVIDADGLYALAELVKERGREESAVSADEDETAADESEYGGMQIIDLGGKWILTPHPGEFRNLYNAVFSSRHTDMRTQRNLFDDIRSTAASLNCSILYKSHVVLACTPAGEISVIEGNNPALGTAGSGDVLAGMVGALLAQGLPSRESMVSAAYIHQKIGVRLYEQSGWFTADDMLKAVSSTADDYTQK